MEFFVSGRQVGKTYYLLQWLSEDPKRIVVCADKGRIDHALDLAQKHGFEVSHEQFVTPSWRDSRLRTSKQPEVAVDDVDLVLQQFLKTPISKVTATGTLKFPKFP